MKQEKLAKKKKPAVKKAVVKEVPKAETLEESLEMARKSGRWMIAVWRVEDLKIYYHRTTSAFPEGDFTQAVKMLAADVTP